MGNLEGQCAIVTGAASGFGAIIARALAGAGARVVVADLDIDGASRVASEIDGHALPVDVGDNASVGRLAYHVSDLADDVDILVNTNGITHPPTPLEDVSEADFDQIYRVNAKSVYLLARHFVPGMKARTRGAILNVAAATDLSLRPSMNWHDAGKAWMIAATRSMAAELATHGLRVNALAPVAGDTALLPRFVHADTPEQGAHVPAMALPERFSAPLDIGAAAAFLCSDAASTITGAVLEIDGDRCL